MEPVSSFFFLKCVKMSKSNLYCFYCTMWGQQIICCFRHHKTEVHFGTFLSHTWSLPMTGEGLVPGIKSPRNLHNIWRWDDNSREQKFSMNLIVLTQSLFLFCFKTPVDQITTPSFLFFFFFSYYLSFNLHIYMSLT